MWLVIFTIIMSILILVSAYLHDRAKGRNDRDVFNIAAVIFTAYFIFAPPLEDKWEKQDEFIIHLLVFAFFALIIIIYIGISLRNAYQTDAKDTSKATGTPEGGS